MKNDKSVKVFKHIGTIMIVLGIAYSFACYLQPEFTGFIFPSFDLTMLLCGGGALRGLQTENEKMQRLERLSARHSALTDKWGGRRVTIFHNTCIGVVCISFIVALSIMLNGTMTGAWFFIILTLAAIAGAAYSESPTSRRRQPQNPPRNQRNT